jgi:hypothetical protein
MLYLRPEVESLDAKELSHGTASYDGRAIGGNGLIQPVFFLPRSEV